MGKGYQVRDHRILGDRELVQVGYGDYELILVDTVTGSNTAFPYPPGADSLYR